MTCCVWDFRIPENGRFPPFFLPSAIDIRRISTRARLLPRSTRARLPPTGQVSPLPWRTGAGQLSASNVRAGQETSWYDWHSLRPRRLVRVTPDISGDWRAIPERRAVRTIRRCRATALPPSPRARCPRLETSGRRDGPGSGSGRVGTVRGRRRWRVDRRSCWRSRPASR